MTDLAARFRSAIEAGRAFRDAPLASYTTFRVGGPADWLVHARTAAEIRFVVAAARDANVDVTVLGGGSNVLIADAGIRGVVIRVHGGDVRRVPDDRLRVDAGVTINGFVRWTINRGFAGVEAWDMADMEFGYDRSRLQRTHEIAIAADFRVGRGESAALRAVARESLAYRKRTQPLESASAGCIFQNPDPAQDRVPDGIPWSAGALVDRAGLKGSREGHARVSPTHGNFIINEGDASAAEIRHLIERCRRAVRDAFGVALRDEIVYLGF